jgi:hypothetical protein
MGDSHSGDYVTPRDDLELVAKKITAAAGGRTLVIQSIPSRQTE